MDGDGVAPQNLSSALCSPWPLFLHHYLVHTGTAQNLTTGIEKSFSKIVFGHDVYGFVMEKSVN